MGGVCGIGKEEKTEKKYEEKPTNRMPAKSRFESISQEDAVLCKILIQKNRLEKKIVELENKEKTYAEDVKVFLKEGKKQDAKHCLALKKYVVTYQNSYRDKILFLEKQSFQIESLKDTADFTKVVAETNRITENLMKNNDTEELEIAMVLLNENKRNNEEINAYLEDDDLNDEFDQLCKEVEDKGYDNVSKMMISHIPDAQIKENFTSEKESKLKASLSYQTN